VSQVGQFTYNGVTEVKTITGDNSLHIPATLGNINILGSANIAVLGTIASSTLNIYIANTVQHAVQIGNISGGISSIPVATNGQVLLGSTNADPAFNNISVGNGIAKVEGPASLIIEGIQATTVQIGVVTLALDAEAIAGTDASKVIVPSSLKAKLGIQTLHGLPIGASDSGALAWTAAPTNGQLLVGSTGNQPVLATLTQGYNILVTNTAGAIRIDLTGTTLHALQVGNATGSLTSLPLGGLGQILTGSATDPVWTTALIDGQLLIGSTGNAVVPATLSQGNNIGIANAHGSITIKVAGTTQYAVQVGSATNDLASLALGTSGQVLTSSGAGANPSFSSPGTGSGLTQYGVVIAEGAGAFQATAAGATGKLLQAKGSANPDWTTSTYPDTIAIGSLLHASAANTVTALTVGSTGQILTGSTGAAPAWSATPTVTTIYATTHDTNVAAAALQMTGTTIQAAGSNADINVTITPKGAGVISSSKNIQAAGISFDSGTTTMSNYTMMTAWTPDLQFNGAKVGPITYSDHGGYYSRIGNIIFYSGFMNLSSKGSSVGDAEIHGLPFTSNSVSASDSYGPMYITNWLTTSPGPMIGKVTNNTNYIKINYTPSGAAQAGAFLTNAQLNDMSAFRFSGFYFV
jgi:hypothetical protein